MSSVVHIDTELPEVDWWIRKIIRECVTTIRGVSPDGDTFRHITLAHHGDELTSVRRWSEYPIENAYTGQTPRSPKVIDSFMDVLVDVVVTVIGYALFLHHQGRISRHRHRLARHAYILRRTRARMSVSVSWNVAFTVPECVHVT